jgi:alpha-amylase
MYARMMMVSRRVAEAEQEGTNNEPLQYARQALYRGQCNCPYWHGAFGGIYLPHLRNAIYNQLIAADNLVDQASGHMGSWCEATVDDYNFDARQEVRLASDKVVALIAPAQGGQLYELDVRSICHNLGATLARRPEAYHQKVLAGPGNGSGDVASIHDRVVFKQAGLDQRLQYDSHPRKSLLDHFYPEDALLSSVALGNARERGDFVSGPYEAKVRRGQDRVQVQLARTGRVDGREIRITKGITLLAGSNSLEIVYLVENLPTDQSLHLAIEFNFAGLPSGADDRYFHIGTERFGQLGKQLDLQNLSEIALTDEWLGIDVRLSTNRPMQLWAFPVETVSQSEGGFELVHQSVAVLPHWHIRGDANGRWSAALQLVADTSLAESRMEQHAVVEVGV